MSLLCYLSTKKKKASSWTSRRILHRRKSSGTDCVLRPYWTFYIPRNDQELLTFGLLWAWYCLRFWPFCPWSHFAEGRTLDKSASPCCWRGRRWCCHGCLLHGLFYNNGSSLRNPSSPSKFMHNVTFLRSCVQRQTTKRLGVASVLLEKDGDVQSSDQQSWVFDGGRLEEEAIYQGHWRVVIVLNQNIGWTL